MDDLIETAMNAAEITKAKGQRSEEMEAAGFILERDEDQEGEAVSRTESLEAAFAGEVEMDDGSENTLTDAEKERPNEIVGSVTPLKTDGKEEHLLYEALSQESKQALESITRLSEQGGEEAWCCVNCSTFLSALPTNSQLIDATDVPTPLKQWCIPHFSRTFAYAELRQNALEGYQSLLNQMQVLPSSSR